jgi:hypothetical protein
MNAPVVAEIEQRIAQLTLGEQLWLIERLANRLRTRESAPAREFERQLLHMSNDPEIQSELAQIEREFSVIESDGLERSAT